MVVIARDLELERAIQGLPPEVQKEIRWFAEHIERLEAGEIDEDDFKRFRLENGVYGIRGAQDMHMVRVKVRFGCITPHQLETLAAIAEQFTPHHRVHITTRQDIQFHHVRRKDVPLVLARIAQSGLTTREACGNTVRNVTACPFAGVSPSEVFDVTPYADAVSRYFLRHPITQNLPRKFKIAFEGCREDHVVPAIHDIGAIATVRQENRRVERGFRLYIAGGLGAQPRAAELLEPFTPAELLIPTCEAVIRVFDRHGERRPDRLHRMRARMKFLAKDWGIDRLREAILTERRALLLTRSGLMEDGIELVEEEPPDVDIPPLPSPDWTPSPEYETWRRTNVRPQKQAGYVVVIIRCELGDITSDGLRTVARVARRWCAGRIRTAISQNLILRWVPESALPWVYQELKPAGLVAPGAHGLADVTRCPGADTCQLALTHSRGLAEALGEVLARDLTDSSEIQNPSIKISGCMNSCGQHHIADIGFYGASTEIDGHPLPQYIVLVGGQPEGERVRFARPVARVPARRAPEVVRRLLAFYQAERKPDESFVAFVDRLGMKPIKRALEDLASVPPFEEAPELYRDLGADEETFRVELGPGECSA